MKNVAIHAGLILSIMLMWGGLITCGLFGILFLSDTSDGIAMLLMIGGGLLCYAGFELGNHLSDIDNEPSHTTTKRKETKQVYEPKTMVETSFIKVRETCKGCGAPLTDCTCSYCGRNTANYRVLHSYFTI